MWFRGKILFCVMMIFCFLPISSAHGFSIENEKEHIDFIEKINTMESNSLVSNKLILTKSDEKLFYPLFINILSANDDNLYVSILCGFQFNSLKDCYHYHGLNVEIINYGLTTIDANCNIKIDGKLLTYMDEDWKDSFSIGPDEGLLVKIMPDKMIEYKKFEFFRFGRIDIEVNVNDIQLKATGFLWCKYILNLQQQ